MIFLSLFEDVWRVYFLFFRVPPVAKWVFGMSMNSIQTSSFVTPSVSAMRSVMALASFSLCSWVLPSTMWISTYGMASYFTSAVCRRLNLLKLFFAFPLLSSIVFCPVLFHSKTSFLSITVAFT